ncbi:MAG: DoxX family protein [Candidatus Kapaibacteriota bacterium]|jgi:putative oxidoreductase
MDSILNRYSHLGLPIFRICASLLMITHGWAKLMKLTAGGEIKFYDFMGMGPEISLALAVIGELFAPLLIIVGYQTRYAAFFVTFTMGVAAFIVHGADPLGEKELALMYFLSFLMIMLTGPGAYSLDKND